MNSGSVLLKQATNCGGTCISNRQPDHLGRRAVEKRKLAEVVVLRDDREPVVARELPDGMIGLASEPRKIHVLGSRKGGPKAVRELWAQVLIEKETHATGGTASRRSRAAANARQARMSSRVRLGKSAST